MSVSPARACAYTVLRRVFEEGAWADRALHGEAARARLDARDRALATRLAYGAVQRRATLDHLIAELTGRSLRRLQPPVLAALRLGLFQLCLLERVPAHAAVGESVELVKRDAPRAGGLVNAVLRRAAEGGHALVAALPESTPAEAAIRHSHPEWVAERWWSQLGPAGARALMAAGNRPAEAALRVNTLKAGREEVAASLGVPWHAAEGLPEGIVVDAAFDAFGAPGWEAGLFMPQSRAAMAVARLVAPRPGERVLDLCAAPGGKTTHLAALMRGEGELVAVERHPGRAEALRRTATRMGATNVTVLTGDAAVFTDPGRFDRVLVDPPCSDLGTLASRPDARWRKSPDQVDEMVRAQRAILDAGARALRPGGTLVYSTCTISAPENEHLVESFLTDEPAFAAEDLRFDLPGWHHPTVSRFAQTLPDRDTTDGFFFARLRRETA